MKIPFHAQLREAEPALAAELSEAVEEAVGAFAAASYGTEESFLLTFDEGSRPCRLRAAEAARSLSSRLSGLAPRLHGWSIFLDAGPGGPEEALRSAKRLWFGIEGDGLFISTRSLEYFRDYFRFGPSGTAGDPEAKECIPILEAIYARPALPGSGTIEETSPRAIDLIMDALGELGVGQGADSPLALLGPGRGPSLNLEAALARLYSDASPRFLRISASAVENTPYGPVAGALGALVSPHKGEAGPGALLSGAERGLLEELSPLLDFLQRSPYRRDCPARIDIRLRLCAAAALRLYARTMRKSCVPAFVILERIEDFPSRSLDLILGLAREQLSGEGIVVLAAGSALPPAWKEGRPRVLEVPGPSPSDMADAALRSADALGDPGASASLALAAAGDPLRFRLALRLLASARGLSPAASTESLAAAALATLPREYAELLLSLRLGEGVLTDDFLDGFLQDSGYVAGLRSPVFSTLAELGFITRDARPRISSLSAAMGCEDALPDRGAAIRGSFAERLRRLRESGGIIPSAALYRRMRAEAEPGAGEDSGSLGLVIDCISADAVYGPSETDREGAIEAPLAPLVDFLSSYAAADRDGSLAALARLEAGAAGLVSAAESGTGPGSASGVELASAAASLARAAFEYADGRAQAAASLAKKALMSLHSLGHRNAEAKAHRMLGLCSLAQEQVQEATDYLSNAYDIASSLSEPMECILSATAEAAADFTLGDLGRASSRAESAAAWAASAFRADWEAACAFISGRAAFETGRYELAEECFGRVRAVARVYGQAEAARRAEIWTGRSAAFSREGMRARELLSRFGEDVEALWFLAELEAWEGAPEKSVLLADEALALAPRPAFFPADSFDWSSGYSSLEGRAVGFFGKRSFLCDQIQAFREFAVGMAHPERDGIASAERLASLAREDRLSVIHPSAHLYFFYRYLILERASPSSMDGASALSKAFKALQLRSTKTGEAAFKDGFLEANRWNRALVEAARTRKLI
jgi:hypothetical protein